MEVNWSVSLYLSSSPSTPLEDISYSSCCITLWNCCCCHHCVNNLVRITIFFFVFSYVVKYYDVNIICFLFKQLYDQQETAIQGQSFSLQYVLKYRVCHWTWTELIATLLDFSYSLLFSFSQSPTNNSDHKLISYVYENVMVSVLLFRRAYPNWKTSFVFLFLLVLMFSSISLPLRLFIHAPTLLKWTPLCMRMLQFMRMLL